MRSTSSTVASCGRLTVLLIAPERNGCTAAIMRTWPMGSMKRVPWGPQRLAQSNTGRGSGLTPRAPPSAAAGAEARVPERLAIDVRRAVEAAGADRVARDLLDGGMVVAEVPERHRHRLVHDLEEPAARALLELHQREIGLDPGGVAVHEQADGTGRGQHGRP